MEQEYEWRVSEGMLNLLKHIINTTVEGDDEIYIDNQPIHYAIYKSNKAGISQLELRYFDDNIAERLPSYLKTKNVFNLVDKIEEYYDNPKAHVVDQYGTILTRLYYSRTLKRFTFKQ